MLSFACNRVFVVIEWSGWRYKEMTDLKEEKENLSKKKSRARRAFETIFFLLAPIKTPTSELLARTSPSFYDVLIAIFGGVAGIIGNTRKDKANNVIPGVAIATALMPPLCTCGYSLASGNWRMLGGAAYLFLINSYFIFGSSEIILYLMDLPEKKVVDPKVLHKNRIRRRIITLIILIPCFLFGASLAYLP